MKIPVAQMQGGPGVKIISGWKPIGAYQSASIEVQSENLSVFASVSDGGYAPVMYRIQDGVAIKEYGHVDMSVEFVAGTKSVIISMGFGARNSVYYHIVEY